MDTNGRRDFLKRLGIGGVVAAGSLGLITATQPSRDRGEHTEGDGVAVGNSRKDETLYTKTEYWDKFYKSAL